MWAQDLESGDSLYAAFVDRHVDEHRLRLELRLERQKLVVDTKAR